MHPQTIDRGNPHTSTHPHFACCAGFSAMKVSLLASNEIQFNSKENKKIQQYWGNKRKAKDEPPKRAGECVAEMENFLSIVWSTPSKAYAIETGHLFNTPIVLSISLPLRFAGYMVCCWYSVLGTSSSLGARVLEANRANWKMFESNEGCLNAFFLIWFGRIWKQQNLLGLGQ